MQESESRQIYGYACVWTQPDPSHAEMFAIILKNILTQRRAHLYPYYPNSPAIDAKDLTEQEKLTLTSDAETEIGNPGGLLSLQLDKLGKDGRLNIGIIARDLKTVTEITKKTRGISAVQFHASVYRDYEGQLIPFRHPLDGLTAIVRLK